MAKALKKRLEILDAATYRFAHFGVAKTTMAEIASDLSLSKASLYYYYPDRNNLFAAVLDRIISEMTDEINEKLANDLASDPYQAMEYVLDARIIFLTRHYKLLEGLGTISQEIPPVIGEAINRGREMELQILRRILAQGMANGKLLIQDIDETTNMFFYAIVGMRFSVLRMTQVDFFPTQEEFDRILVLQKKLVVILLDGLSARAT